MKGVIFHYGLFKIVWDWFVLVLVLYTAIEVPFIVAFIHEKTSSMCANFDSIHSISTVLIILACMISVMSLAES